MQSDSLCVKVISNTSHLHSEFSVSRASVCVGWPQESNRVVSLLDDQHSHDFLVTVDNEVPSKLVRILVSLNELFLAQVSQVTAT